MSLLISRANAGGWSAGELLTPVQINTIDQNSVDVADYVEGLFHDVTLYGAAGNGTADDTTPITNALNDANTSGAPVYFPPGIYACSNLPLPTRPVLIGEIGQSTLLCNHATNPIISGSANDGAASIARPSGRIAGLAFQFGSFSNTVGRLLDIGGNKRVLFESCYFDDTLSSASGTGGLVRLGSTGATTRAQFKNCYFEISGNGNEQAVGYLDGTTYIDMIGCTLNLLSVARSGTVPLVQGSRISANGCRFDIESATGSPSALLMSALINGSMRITGSHITDIGGGTPVVFGTTAGNVQVFESANRFPANATLFSSSIDVATGSSIGSLPTRHLATTQSGGGTLSMNPRIYSSAYVNITDNTGFTIALTDGWLGSTFDLVLHNSTGSPTSITWGSSFGDFSTVSAGTAPPGSISTGRYITSRFIYSDGPDGDAWYPLGSALHAS